MNVPANQHASLKTASSLKHGTANHANASVLSVRVLHAAAFPALPINSGPVLAASAPQMDLLMVQLDLVKIFLLVQLHLLNLHLLMIKNS